MDLIGLGLRYLNLIIVMAKEAQVKWHKYINIWALISLKKRKKKKKKKENPSLLSELYVYIGIYIKIGDLLSLRDPDPLHFPLKWRMSSSRTGSF